MVRLLQFGLMLGLVGLAGPTAKGATVTFFNSSQIATEVASGVTSDTISSNGYLFTYTRDKLFTGGVGLTEPIGRSVRVPWPQGIEAQAVTSGPNPSKAKIVIERVDGETFDIASFTAKLLANTAGTGGAIEIMPSLNGEDAFNDPLYFDVSGNYGMSFSYNTTPNYLGSTELLTGYDRYSVDLFVDFALTALTLDSAFSTPFDPADTDQDGDVDTADLTTMFQNFTGAVGLSGGRSAMQGDTDLDGDVDTADITLGLQHFTGASLATASTFQAAVQPVPEPPSHSLAVVALVGGGFFWLQGGRRKSHSRSMWLPLVMSCVLCVFTAAQADAASVYNVSAFAPGDPLDDAAAQTAWLDAVGTAGYATYFEGFTGTAWDGARSTIVGGTHVATSISSQGINWHSSAGDYITTSDANYGVTPWHIYSKGGSPQETLHAVPATIIGESNRTLYGLGFWASGGPPLKGKLHVILDDTIDLKFEQITGYDGNPPEPVKETIRLSSGKQFFGVLAPEGFTKFQLLEVEGVLEDQVLMWAADFTFAAIPDAADTDHDFDVDTADLTTMFQNFTGDIGPAGGKSMMQGDTDGDGDVDTADITLGLQTFTGATAASLGPTPEHVPEPSSLLLLAVGLLGLIGTRALRSALG